MPLDRVISKLKGTITRKMHRANQRLSWQENVFEHRLRPEESAESYAFYIFMNPYRASLCSTEADWPWWVCTEPCRFRFLALRRDNGSPQPEWLEEAERVAQQIVHRA